MSPREQFAATASALLDEREDLALVYAEISGQYFHSAARRHPERVVNVGIREQLLVSAAAGMALTGIRPIAHTFAPFLVSRAYEQIKLDFGHQGVGGVLVSSGGSYDIAGAGRTHQGPEDVALMLTVPGTRIHVPGTTAEVDAAVREAAAGEGLHYVRVSDVRNAHEHTPGVHVVRRGEPGAATVIALGPVLDAALAATTEGPETVIYANRLGATDLAELGRHVESTDVLVVEPWLEGSTAHLIGSALAERPRRITAAGVRNEEFRRYGTPGDHARAHGLDASGIRRRLDDLRRAATAS